jgi:hypothetical protein
VGDHLGRAEPYHQFARNGIAAAELFRTAGVHVPRRDRRRRREQVPGVLGKLGHRLDLDERIRRLLKVNAERGARVAGKRPALRRVLARVEHQPVILDYEPHRSNQRAPVGSAVAQLSRPCAFQQEGADLRVGE